MWNNYEEDEKLNIDKDEVLEEISMRRMFQPSFNLHSLVALLKEYGYVDRPSIKRMLLEIIPERNPRWSVWTQGWKIDLLTIEEARAVKLYWKSRAGWASWAVHGSSTETDVPPPEVQQVLADVSDKLAELVARDVGALYQMEWRDLERMMATVFDGLGFEVTLTPASKDGGKDLVVECYIYGKAATYYVEIKHWRSKIRVGSGPVRDFIRVVIRDRVKGGLILSTSGFVSNVAEQLTVLERTKITLGGRERIVTLCRTYVRKKSGVWYPPDDLSHLLSDE